MKWKLLIYLWTERNGESSSCYMFEFNTEAAAREASAHFSRGNTYCLVIEDTP